MARIRNVTANVLSTRCHGIKYPTHKRVRHNISFTALLRRLFFLETADEIPCHKGSPCQSAARFRTIGAARYKQVLQAACGRQGYKYHLADYYGRALSNIERRRYLVSFAIYLFIRNWLCHGLPVGKDCLYIYICTIPVTQGQELSVLSMCKHPCPFAPS